MTNENETPDTYIEAVLVYSPVKGRILLCTYKDASGGVVAERGLFGPVVMRRDCPDLLEFDVGKWGL